MASEGFFASLSIPASKPVSRFNQFLLFICIMENSRHQNIQHHISSIVRKLIAEATRALIEIETLGEEIDGSAFEKKTDNNRRIVHRHKARPRNKRFL